jgi:O-antigen/teichoic acid export membrane protein
MLRHIVRPCLRIEPRCSGAIIRATGTFLGMDSLLAISASLNFVLLSKFAGETAVGLFSAASQLMVPGNLLCQSVALSIFPVMCRRLGSSFQSLQHIAENSLELLLAITLPAAVGLFFLANSALLLLYGKQDFLLATGALRIMLWNLILFALTSILGRVLLASLREKVLLRIYIIGVVVNVGLSGIFISQFGLMGAAIAGLLAEIVNTSLHYIPVAKRLFTLSLGRLVWKPVIASTGMALYLALVGNREVFLTIVSAGFVYMSILLALGVWSSGGLHQFKARYLYLWSE